MKTLTLLGRIAAIISFPLGILCIYWLFLKITGHSPSIEEVILMAITGLGTITVAALFLLFRLAGDVGELKGMFIEHAKNSDRRFDTIERKIDMVSQDLKSHLNKKSH